MANSKKTSLTVTVPLKACGKRKTLDMCRARWDKFSAIYHYRFCDIFFIQQLECFKMLFQQPTDQSEGVWTSVADPDPVFLGHPDPDPGKYRIRIFYPQKDPYNSNFLVI